MAIVNVEVQMNGASDAKGSVIRQITVAAVLRGAAANASSRPKPPPGPEASKQGV